MFKKDPGLASIEIDYVASPAEWFIKWDVNPNSQKFGLLH